MNAGADGWSAPAFSAFAPTSAAAFRGGYNAIFDVKSGAVGYGKVSARVPRADIVKLEAIRRQIAAGRIRP